MEGSHHVLPLLTSNARLSSTAKLAISGQPGKPEFHVAADLHSSYRSTLNILKTIAYRQQIKGQRH